MRGISRKQRQIIVLAAGLVMLAGCAQFKQRMRSLFARDDAKTAQASDENTTPNGAKEENANAKPIARKPAAPPQPEGWARPASQSTIGPDILMVNNEVLTVDEVVFGIREGSDHFGTAPYSPPTSLKDAERIALSNIRQEVGALLLYEKAQANLTEQQRTAIDNAIQKRIDQRVTVEFGGSRAKLEQQMRAHNMSLLDYKTWLKRQMLAREYVREEIAPQATITRDEMQKLYSEKTKSSGKPETRELFLIEAPYAAFLPERRSWKRASDSEKQTARAAAQEHIRTAQQRLQNGVAFVEVAQQLDKGPQRDNGGSWGKIGRPLRGKYERPSQRLFQMEERQVSEPIQTDDGWFIVRCGAIDGRPLRTPFADCQQQLREELLERKFNEYSVEYLKTLSESASISWMDGFVRETIRRLMVGESPPSVAIRQ